MNVRKLVHPLLALPLLLAACGEDGGGGGLGNLVQADRTYFDGQSFVCAQNPTAPDNCPPFSCEVDINGVVYDCDESCDSSGCTNFVFMGPEGLDLCVPSLCEVGIDGSAQCTVDCAEDDITCYVMDLFETSCG